MAIANLVSSADPYLKVPDDSGENGTTQREFRDFVSNTFNALRNLVDAGKLWQAQVEFAADAVVVSPNMVENTMAYVTAAGTTGDAEPSWPDVGNTVTDGTVEYLMVPRVVLFASEDEVTAGTETGKTISPATLKTWAAGEVTPISQKVSNLSTSVSTMEALIGANNSESYYFCDGDWAGDKTTIITPATVQVMVNGTLYTQTESQELSLTEPTNWDDNQMVAAVNRAGKDFYIYACVPSSGTAPTFILSANSTVPTGDDYTAENTRKIGGFHCLCVDAGTIFGHTLSDYVAGDILPASVWDLWHRPECDAPEGMAYFETCDVWMDIYFDSWDGENLVSVYGGICADGTSTKKWHGEASLEQLMSQGKRLPWRHEFQMAAKGSNEETNIYGSADPNTTGGHVDTASRRMISNIGLEDCCGVLWQWLMDLGFAGGTRWTESVYSSGVDSTGYGQTYGTLYRLLGGGPWTDGAYCGSRAAACDAASANVNAGYGCRGASEPLHRKNERRQAIY